MNRDVMYVDVEDKTLVISVDNVGAVGQKEKDVIKSSYQDIGYFCCRTVLIENITANSKPLSLHVTNFCGDNWNLILEGINQAQEELGINLEVNGSTESNFKMIQSGIGITCVGILTKKNKKINNIEYAVIGTPLVGSEVLENKNSIISLSEIKTLTDLDFVSEVLAVGSKGIKEEFRYFSNADIKCELDILKSGGPSTAVIVSYDSSFREELKDKFGKLFHQIEI